MGAAAGARASAGRQGRNASDGGEGRGQGSAEQGEDQGGLQCLQKTLVQVVKPTTRAIQAAVTLSLMITSFRKLVLLLL
uniref:Uncharacterized protein n=1 Tax=Arundo donax TaxID=35708 RepID=A0A0A9SI10_ARUDO